ncbi:MULTISPECIES: hypothetical protein [Rhodopseudomonas]|uniref:Uncharacterized protein n=1 Tax=Rhodopseudomonas palustris TaxID=1076 RepID=A0A0D7F2X2_RHOPL|nr:MULTISPECIES: hypothetical protein [Rhodopseudomonas]KIZ47394.1 hypothetical protein OO17_04615 [Rhodopseudomonas palustris]MDF3809261.1 hypothetical protein [Rhodopseudomonas sp. BAL398]WOK19054.1 hypothetical protein RBJ75_05920 [Rhodopseudomonas sp. BAL398]
MVARPGTYQASNNAGELKPELHGRTDIKQFYAGLARAENIEPVPQGGSRLAPRTRHIGVIRNVLAPIAAASASSNLGPHTVGNVVIVQVNFSGAPLISAITCASLQSTITIGQILQFERFDGTDWHAFGAAFSCDPTGADRVVAMPPRTTVQARAVRLRMISAPPATISFATTGCVASYETDALSAVKLRPFTFAIDQSYVSVYTNGVTDFYRGNNFSGMATTGIVQSQLALLDVQQRFDTVLAFHEDIIPRRIKRNGADNEWISDTIPLIAIPSVDLGGTYTNAVVDVWQIYLRFPKSTEDDFASGVGIYLSISVNGEETSAAGLPTGPDWVSFVAALKAFIEALPSVEPGITLTEDHSVDGSATLNLSFTGAGNVGNRFAVTAQVVNTNSAAATTVHSVLGSPGGEPIISVGRGWPACANYYQERLILGGFKAKRGAWMASVSGEYFTFNTEQVAASGGILVNLDTDGAERIQHIARSRHLLFFTSDAEYFVADRALSRAVVPTVVNTSRNGSAPGIPIVDADGQLIYISRNNALIYSASYNDVSQAYISEPISLLASHIASDIADMAIQKASTATDAARLWMPRNDGTATLGIMLRNQDVVAFTRWTTDGKVKAVCVDGTNQTYLAVERQVGGAAQLHLERAELGLLFDGTIEQSFDEAVTHIPNLGPHDGSEVWAQADGYIVGPFTVADSAITLAVAATHVLVGRWTPPRARTLPLPSEVAERIVVKKPKRVHTVRLDLVDTSSVAIGANGFAAKNVGLARAGDQIDAPQAAISRTIVVSGLSGFTDDGQVEITQTKPGTLAWRGLTIEATR